MNVQAHGRIVVGVAGHIDHGKTSLVRALTGVDTDRLPEEKARGITIELGFAAMTLPSGRHAAVIDMPGHERFVRAMIAGAGGVDALLLVIAANEGVMPQTREHLAIASLMGVRAGVVALSKSDLAPDDVLALAKEEVMEVLQGTMLEGCEIVPVSAQTGAGVEALRAALDRVAVVARTDDGPALLPIDRVFVRKGFGAVVTGTLVSGAIREGETMGIGPLGVDARVHPVRVRGMQIHGEACTEAHAGTRLAVNLAGVDAAEIPRGAWLFRAGEVALSQSFDARVTVLAATSRALARRTRLELAVGAAHTEATVAWLEADSVAPGETALARITTSAPVAVRPGERFVLRGPPSLAGVGSTVGGGEVVRPIAERARRREIALARAQRIEAQGVDRRERARAEAEAVGARGVSAAELFARTGWSVTNATLAATGLVSVEADRFVASTVMDAAGQRMLQQLSAFHAAEPAQRGADVRALRGVGDDAFCEAVLTRLVAQKKIQRAAGLVARAGWRPRDPDAVPHLFEVARIVAGAGITAPRPDEIAATLKVDPKALVPAWQRLVEKGAVVRVRDDLYVDAAAMADLERRLVAHLEAHGTIDAQGFKELTGASRKWAIPIAEHFDVRKVTMRIGDVRKLRGRSGEGTS